jgi:PncC family amidohydrolase
MSDVQKVAQILMDYEYKIAFAESMTGGALVAELVKIPNVSTILDYSVVTYAESAKETVLGIPKMLFDVHGVVSKVIAIEMAKSIALLAKSNVGVGITGNAGPTAQPNSQVGEVWFAFYYQGESYSYHLQLKNDGREAIIEHAKKVVYQMLLKLLTK